tara:strand:- start:184 stop:828 length:645 start_codon:yes stop_codon:yes gene_type:complete
MAKIHKNADKFPIQWDGDVVQFEGDKKNDNIPSKVDVTWNAGRPVTPYEPCHGGSVSGYNQCTADVSSYFFEDFDGNGDGIINVTDYVESIANGAPSAFGEEQLRIVLNEDYPPNGPTSLGTATETEFTWGDVNFIQEIMDGIGTGSRRARQDRLNKLDDDKKKRLIHLICRVKGEKVYDDYTEVQDIEVKVDDVELVAENIIGKIKLEIKSGV